MKRLLFSLILTASGPHSAAVPGYEPVAAFTAAPQNPDRGALLRLSDGNFYGLSANGGVYGQGTLFRITPAGLLSVLVHFSGSNGAARGTSPRGGLYHDGNGWLWGTTLGGGVLSLGTVFKYHLSTRTFVTVAEFTATGAVRGNAPYCTLVPDDSGYLWGTAQNGATAGNGTVFKVNMATGVLTTVAEFTGNAGAVPGRAPYAGLTNDGAGKMWGVTQGGGTANLGTVFHVNMANGAFTSVLSFTGMGGAAKGSSPHATLLSDGAGFLWGTTFTGGAPDGGTVFKISIASGAHTVVQELTEAASGRFPYAGLMNDGGGYLWGTTTVGGGASGVVFKIHTGTGALTKLGGFTAATGSTTASPLVAGEAGYYWGTANLSGLASRGSIYKVNAVTGAVNAVVTLGDTIDPARGKQPDGGLEDDPSGNLWGTTRSGGAGNFGTVFRVDGHTGAVTTAVEFTGTAGAFPGSVPQGRLISDGNYLWGVTSNGGAGDRGTIFKYGLNGQGFTSVLTFTGTTGAAKGQTPRCRLLRQGTQLWGTTFAGGAADLGTVFKIAMSDGALTTVKEFTGTSIPVRGSAPCGGLVDDGNGFLWGATRSGGTGPASNGTVYKINVSTGDLTTVVNFTGSSGTAKGSQPYGELTPDGLGWFWGTTNFGGGSDRGSVFKVKISDSTFESVVSFTGGAAAPKGGGPVAGLTSDGRGGLWGLTSYVGANQTGTVFRVDAATGALTTPFEFSGLGGAVPGQSAGYGPLFLHSDTHLYGAVLSGGAGATGDPAGYGQIFRIRFGPTPLTLPADGLTTGGAVLHGTVNPNGLATTVSFELSTDPLLNGAIPISAVSALTGQNNTTAGTAPEVISATLTGLTAGTTYYYRVRAVNSDNPQPQRGMTLSFTTPVPHVPGIADWLAGYGVGGAAAAPDADPDGDGISNAVEYVAGTNPAAHSPLYPPSAVLTVTALVCTFQRADFSETPDVSLALETSTDLTNWNGIYTVGATTALSSQGVTVAENGFGLDTVTVAIPASSVQKLYCRLKVTVTP